MSDARDDLPLPDYDHLPLETLRSLLHSLDADALETLLAREEAHGDRLPVTEAIRHRLQRRREGEEPSGDRPAVVAPDGSAPPARTDATTDAPPRNPPRHGVPGGPTQPR